MRIEKDAIVRTLHEEPEFSQLFLERFLACTIRVEEDLVDPFFNSSGKRLARALLLLANFGKESWPEPIIMKVSQETLAEMIGTTRTRVNFFMNKFRKLGFISCNGTMEVHSSLLLNRTSRIRRLHHTRYNSQALEFSQRPSFFSP
jgi:CRP/FNR family cyclic AMP-dependent transcriptional regulator